MLDVGCWMLDEDLGVGNARAARLAQRCVQFELPPPTCEVNSASSASFASSSAAASVSIESFRSVVPRLPLEPPVIKPAGSTTSPARVTHFFFTAGLLAAAYVAVRCVVKV